MAIPASGTASTQRHLRPRPASAIFTVAAPNTDGQARSKLDNSRIESALGLGSTARNWNTCDKLLKLLEESEAQGS